MKKTLVLGATPNPRRYAYLATHELKKHGHEIILVGIKNGEVAGHKIFNNQQSFNDIDTITLYIGARHQPQWYDYILKSKPNRIIFNPGTENIKLEKIASEKGIETIHACTLVMLSIGNY